MKIIVRPRRAGKTTELMRLAETEYLYIVCPNMMQVDQIWKEAQLHGIKIPQPITWSEYVQGRYRGRSINGFVIDNLDMCLQSMTNVEIKAMSMTGEEEPWEWSIVSGTRSYVNAVATWLSNSYSKRVSMVRSTKNSVLATYDKRVKRIRRGSNDD